MKKDLALLTLTAAVFGVGPHAAVTTRAEVSRTVRARTVRVAAPTGDRARDRASIVAAFRRAGPGDTVRFARGTYVVGELIRVSTPRLTLVGEAGGTVLRGCRPDAYEALRREERGVIEKLVRSHRTSRVPAREAELQKRCGMFQLTGGHDTVRDLTFEYMRLGLMLGYEPQHAYRPAEGGDLVEGNTFRNTNNSIRVGVSSPEPTVIRHNTFVDTYHAVSAGGADIRVLENTILAPAPALVPANQYPSDAIGITAIPPGAEGAPEPPEGRCDDNVIAGNVIVGYPSGIEVGARPGTVCRGNIIRDNTVVVRRVVIPHSSVDWGLFPDSSLVGVPISISAPAVKGRAGRVEGSRIEGNRILGAEGCGIEIRNASDNRVADNTIAGIVRRDPFPGNDGSASDSPDANGAGIWVSSGSDGNEIVDNTFDDVATYAVVLEGDHNRVRFRRARDRAHDLGTDNRVTRAHAR